MAFTSVKSLGSRAVKGYIYDALDLPQDLWVDRLSNRLSSDQESELYKMLGASPTMRPWDGGRLAKRPLATDFTIKNIPYEATMEITVDEIRRDKTGLIEMRIRELAEKAIYHDAKLLTSLIVAGESALCYDGQFFFDTDHVEGDSGSQSNDLTSAAATNTQPTVAEMESAILSATAAMYAFKDDQGEPVNGSAKAFDVMVPPVYLAPACGALGTSVILEGGASRNNLIQAVGSLGGLQYNLVVNPWLTNADRFYIFRNDASTKPLIRQYEKDLTVNVMGEGSSEEIMNRRHLYLIDCIKGYGYGRWSGAAVHTFT